MTQEAQPDARPELSVSRTLRWAATALGPWLGLAAITLFFAIQTRGSGTFLSVENWRTISVQTVVVGVAALGLTLVMITGGIDLSIGSAVALVTVAVAVLVRDGKWPMPAAMAAGVLVGGLCGLFNGILITRLGLIPFIVTLGSMKIFRGLASGLADNTQVYVPMDVRPAWMDRLLSMEGPQPSWLLLAPGVWVYLILGLGLMVVLRYMVLGRYLYAIGSNEATAKVCGIDVPGVKLLVYSLAGLATGLAGVMQFVEISGQGDPSVADGLELRAIAAVVIGGGSLSGGEGTVVGTLIGALIMSVLVNGCVHAGYASDKRDVIIGTIIVLAVLIDRLRRRSR